MHTFLVDEDDAALLPPCPLHLTACMAQDASVKVRRSACSLWLAFSRLQDTPDDIDTDAERGHHAEPWTGLPADVKQVLVARSQDKCAFLLCTFRAMKPGLEQGYQFRGRL